jgi:hypothetical protein
LPVLNRISLMSGCWENLARRTSRMILSLTWITKNTSQRAKEIRQQQTSWHLFPVFSQGTLAISAHLLACRCTCDTWACAHASTTISRV